MFERSRWRVALLLLVGSRTGAAMMVLMSAVGVVVLAILVSVLDRVYLARANVDREGVVYLAVTDPDSGAAINPTPLEFASIAAATSVLDVVAGIEPKDRAMYLNVPGLGGRYVSVAMVTPTLHEVLGISLLRGRHFADSYEEGFIVRERLWTNLLGGREDLSTVVATLDGAGRYPLLGVVPETEMFPWNADVWIYGTSVLSRNGRWRAIDRDPSNRAVMMVGKASVGVTPAAVAQVVAARLAEGKVSSGAVQIEPLGEVVRSRVLPAARLLVLASTTLIAIIAVNGLLLMGSATARAVGALSILRGLGVSYSALLRDLGVGVLVLCGCGYMIGIGCAIIGSSGVSALVDRVGVPGQLGVTQLGRTVALAAVIGTAILWWLMAGASVAMQLNGRRVSRQTGRWRRSEAIVLGAEVAGGVVLCSVLAALWSGTDQFLNRPRGYEPVQLASARLTLASTSNDEVARLDLIHEIVTIASRHGTTEAVGLVGRDPFAGDTLRETLRLPGRPSLRIGVHAVGGDFFRAIGLSLPDPFALSRGGSSATPAVLSLSTARRVAPDTPLSLVGSELQLGRRKVVVVAVVDDIQLDPNGTDLLAAYLPMHAWPQLTLTLLLRQSSTTLDRSPFTAVAQGLRGKGWAGEPVPESERLRHAIGSALALRRLIVGFILVAAFLAATTMLAGQLIRVAEARRSLTVRRALGAPRWEEVWRIGLTTVVPALAGVALGVGVAVVVGRTGVAWGLLAVPDTGATTFAGVSIGLAAVALSVGTAAWATSGNKISFRDLRS